MLLLQLVETSAAVGATRARSTKVAAIAALLEAVGPDELEPAVGFLTGAPRQGRMGVGWSTVAEVSVPPAADASLSIADLDAALAALEQAGGPGSARERHEILVGVLARATAAEADFVRRLLVGELRQGALAGLVTDAAARASDTPLPAFRRALMLDGDLGRVTHLARVGGPDALAAVHLEPFRPVLPMLAKSEPDVTAALARTGPASVEWKLDGARIQVHRVGAEVRVFTRNLNDITHRLPDVVAAVVAFPANELVLDGEAVGLEADARPSRFQETMRTFGADAARPDSALSARYFDCLHRDGVDLLDEPLAVRRATLVEVVGAHAVPAITFDAPVTAADFLADALASGHEGVMVKGLDSTYEAGRRGAAWVKVKPVHTLDLVVLAAEWGHGRRRGWLSNLHLGARDPEGGWVMVGKTFKGLTDELLAWQTARLRELADDDSGHVVTVRPELVVEIALDGVQASTRYPGGVALRFARVRRYRDDKPPAEADTIDAVRSMLR